MNLKINRWEKLTQNIIQAKIILKNPEMNRSVYNTTVNILKSRNLLNIAEVYMLYVSVFKDQD